MPSTHTDLPRDAALAILRTSRWQHATDRTRVMPAYNETCVAWHEDRDMLCFTFETHGGPSGERHKRVLLLRIADGQLHVIGNMTTPVWGDHLPYESRTGTITEGLKRDRSESLRFNLTPIATSWVIKAATFNKSSF